MYSNRHSATKRVKRCRKTKVSRKVNVDLNNVKNNSVKVENVKDENVRVDSHGVKTKTEMKTRRLNPEADFFKTARRLPKAKEKTEESYKTKQKRAEPDQTKFYTKQLSKQFGYSAVF